MNNKIVIITGDPNSINSEIIFKSWKRLNNQIKKNIYLIGSYELLRKQFKKLNYKSKIIKVKNLNESLNKNDLKIIDIPLKFSKPFNVSKEDSSKYIINSFSLAHMLASKKLVKGIINCPINKELLRSKKRIGVTEFLASKCKIKDDSEVMLIHNKVISVSPITTHINIKNVSKNIEKKIIIKKMLTLEKEFKKLFKKKPRIGILGLNPHNDEYSKNSEEVKKIIPAISFLKKKKLNIYGPLVSDTLFINSYKEYDVIVGMYHDQVLTPFKTLYHFNAINITLGLNYVRVSPDHGPALDLIGKNKANYQSLFECINFVNKLN